MGVYGESGPQGIEKLGMVSLDFECQAQKDAEAAAAAAAAAAANAGEPVTKLVEVTEPEESGPLGLSLFTWAIIGIGFVSFCLILNLTICALRKGFGKKEHIAVTSIEPVAPVEKKERRSKRKSTAADIENSGAKLNGPSVYPHLN